MEMPKRRADLADIRTIPGGSGAAVAGIRAYLWVNDEEFHRVFLLKATQSGWLVWDEEDNCHREGIDADALRVMPPDPDREPPPKVNGSDVRMIGGRPCRVRTIRRGCAAVTCYRPIRSPR